MSEKALNRFGLDEYEAYEMPDAVGVECKFCGCDGLHWEEFGRRWMLFDEDDVLHDCRTGAADDFDDLDEIDG